MTGVCMIQSFSALLRSDCGFDHMIHTMPDAKFHSKMDGVILIADQCEQAMV